MTALPLLEKKNIVLVVVYSLPLDLDYYKNLEPENEQSLESIGAEPENPLDWAGYLPNTMDWAGIL